jgi:hypothetical protein
MRQIRDVLRLKFAQGLSERAIAMSLGLGKGSVGTYLRRARAAGLNWPLPDGLDDDGLELLLFPASPTVPGSEPPCSRLVDDRQGAAQARGHSDAAVAGISGAVS